MLRRGAAGHAVKCRRVPAKRREDARRKGDREAFIRSGRLPGERPAVAQRQGGQVRLQCCYGASWRACGAVQLLG